MFKSIILSFQLELDLLVNNILFKAEAFETDLISQASIPVLFHFGNGDSVMGSLGAGETGLDGGKVELHGNPAELWVLLTAVILSEEPLPKEIFLDHQDFLWLSGGELEVVDRLFIDREETHGG